MRAIKCISIAMLVSLGALWAADILAATLASRDLVNRVGCEDYLACLEARVSIGMTRQHVERSLVGFRSSEAYAAVEGGYVVSYGYWFGFIPPIPRYGLKYVGEVVVTYSDNGKVIKVSHWYN
jgi:hypothetical protein